MRNTFRALGAAGALICFAAASAVAQDVSDMTAGGTSMSPVNGIYSPNPHGGATTVAVTSATVGAQARSLSGGNAADRAVGAVLGGGPTTALAGSLTGAGAPAAQVNALMSALTSLAGNPSAGALQSAIQAYNALVKAAPTGFVNAPPGQILAIRGALMAIRAGH
jgi:hypothetical protein